MNPAQNSVISSDDKNNTDINAVSLSSAGTGKEREMPVVAKEMISEVGREADIPKEVEKAGVEVIKETIELPPDVKRLGVTQTGPSVPAISVTATPQVVLPISDQTVIAGLHAQLLSSLRWLAQWCVRRLKKAHIVLKVIHGKIVRVKD